MIEKHGKHLLVEKLPLKDNTSFVANIHTTPHFEVPWHQHVEYELILFLMGEGHSYIGNHVGSFSAGDIYFLGSNLPHTFQKSHPDLITSAAVIHFKEDFWGKDFIKIPECKELKELLVLSAGGMSVSDGRLKNKLKSIIPRLVEAKGFDRIKLLIECLSAMLDLPEFHLLSTQELFEMDNKNQERIDRIFKYTIDNFQDDINLKKVAMNVQMSIPAFCAYFKRCTKKTYIDFVNEVRIGYACKQLEDSTKTVESICYESGFNTVANFNKQFFKVKNLTPSKYRKTLMKFKYPD